MIEKTELGVLISYETWDELQEKLESTASEEVETLRKENQRLKNALKQVEQRILKGEAHA